MKYKGSLDCAIKLYQEGGIRSSYRGVGATLLRGEGDVRIKRGGCGGVGRGCRERRVWRGEGVERGGFGEGGVGRGGCGERRVYGSVGEGVMVWEEDVN